MLNINHQILLHNVPLSGIILDQEPYVAVSILPDFCISKIHIALLTGNMIFQVLYYTRIQLTAF